MEKILYITTFNKKLYNLSGKDFINSFLKYIKNGVLLICYEDEKPDFNSDRLIFYNLAEDYFLKKWLETNKCRIPKFYGGELEDNDPLFGKTYKEQPWAKYRASRYFRKVVSLNYGLNTYSDNYDYIFVVDCDCEFKKNIDTDVVNLLFEDNISMFYFWGLGDIW